MKALVCIASIGIEALHTFIADIADAPSAAEQFRAGVPELIQTRSPESFPTPPERGKCMSSQRRWSVYQ
jgi:hypothetical protein